MKLTKPDLLMRACAGAMGICAVIAMIHPSAMPGFLFCVASFSFAIAFWRHGEDN